MNPDHGGPATGPIRLARWATAAGAAIWACSAYAHVLSVSQGTLSLDGQSVRYELRIPLSEVPAGPDREQVLLRALQVKSDGTEGTRAGGVCSEDAGQDLYRCEAEFLFAEPPSKVSVRCDLPSVTVPQHVHILRSGDADAARQTVFDITSREAEIRFVPPTWLETASTEVGAGFRKAITSPELVLFLVALALAGRARRELAGCLGAFLLAQACLAVAGSLAAWQFSVGFLEAASALTVAYVASEVLFLPDAKNRWLVCGAMGCFHGLFLGAFLVAAQMNPAYVLPGALSLEAVLAAGIGGIRLKFIAGRSEKLVALLLLVLGLGWFAMRVIG